MGKKRTRKSVRRREEKLPNEEEVVLIPEPAWVIKEIREDRSIENLVGSTPQADLLGEFEKDRKRFWVVILFSLVLHLSAVTIFKIVVYVPRSDLQYMKMNLIQVDSPVIISSDGQLKISRKIEEIQLDEGDEGRIESLSSVVELPRLEFEQMKKLRLRSTLVEEDIVEKPLIEEFRDSWAQFGVGVNRIRESLSALYPFGEPEKKETKSGREDSFVRTQEVGGGVRVTYRALNPPFNRKILFVPVSLELISRIGKGSMKNYDFMIELSPEGDVLKVVDLNIDKDEYVDTIKELIANIKFEPLIDYNGERGIQQVTLKYSIDVGEK